MPLRAHRVQAQEIKHLLLGLARRFGPRCVLPQNPNMSSLPENGAPVEGHAPTAWLLAETLCSWRELLLAGTSKGSPGYAASGMDVEEKLFAAFLSESLSELEQDSSNTSGTSGVEAGANFPKAGVRGLLQCLIQSASAYAVKGRLSLCTHPECKDNHGSCIASLRHSQAVLLSVVESAIWCLVSHGLWGPSQCLSLAAQQVQAAREALTLNNNTSRGGSGQGPTDRHGTPTTSVDAQVAERVLCFALSGATAAQRVHRPRSKGHPGAAILARSGVPGAGRGSAGRDGDLEERGPREELEQALTALLDCLCTRTPLVSEAHGISAQQSAGSTEPDVLLACYSLAVSASLALPGLTAGSSAEGGQASGVSAALVRLFQSQRSASARASKATAAAAAAERRLAVDKGGPGAHAKPPSLEAPGDRNAPERPPLPDATGAARREGEAPVEDVQGESTNRAIAIEESEAMLARLTLCTLQLCARDLEAADWSFVVQRLPTWLRASESVLLLLQDPPGIPGGTPSGTSRGAPGGIPSASVTLASAAVQAMLLTVAALGLPASLQPRGSEEQRQGNGGSWLQWRWWSAASSSAPQASKTGLQATADQSAPTGQGHGRGQGEGCLFGSFPLPGEATQGAITFAALREVSGPGKSTAEAAEQAQELKASWDRTGVRALELCLGLFLRLAATLSPTPPLSGFRRGANPPFPPHQEDLSALQVGLLGPVSPDPFHSRAPAGAAKQGRQGQNGTWEPRLTPQDGVSTGVRSPLCWLVLACPEQAVHAAVRSVDSAKDGFDSGRETPGEGRGGDEGSATGAAVGSRAVGALYRVMKHLGGLEAEAAAFHCLSCEHVLPLAVLLSPAADSHPGESKGEGAGNGTPGDSLGAAAMEKTGENVLHPMLEDMLKGDSRANAGDSSFAFPLVCSPKTGHANRRMLSPTAL